MTTRGAVMLCVCRGKVAEGIDLPNERVRGVILVGVPYPPSYFFLNN